MKAPVVTGQTSSIDKDTRDLAKVVVGMVDALLTGTQPRVDDTETYDDGKRSCRPIC